MGATDPTQWVETTEEQRRRQIYDVSSKLPYTKLKPPCYPYKVNSPSIVPHLLNTIIMENIPVLGSPSFFLIFIVGSSDISNGRIIIYDS